MGRGEQGRMESSAGGLLRSHGLSAPLALPCSCVCHVNNIYVFLASCYSYDVAFLVLCIFSLQWQRCFVK